MTDNEEERRKNTEEFTPSGKQEVKCSECNKSMLRSSLSRHFKRHHGNVSRMKEMTDARERQVIEMREKQRFMSNWVRRPEGSEKSLLENHETEKERLIEKEPESDLMKRERQMAEVKERLLMISRQRQNIETGSVGEKPNVVINQRDLVDKGNLGPGVEARERQLVMMREKQNLMMKAMERQVVEARGKERTDFGEGNEKLKAIKMERRDERDDVDDKHDAVYREAISKEDSALAQDNFQLNNESMSENDEQYFCKIKLVQKRTLRKKLRKTWVIKL